MFGLAFYIFLFFSLIVLVQIYFYLFIFLPLSTHKEYREQFQEPISIVICGYNEAQYWQQLIEQLLQQDYATYEIVLVNDQSTDDTPFIFKQWEHHPKIKIVNITNDIKKGLGKKFALTLGIKASKYDYLLLTDADCLPKDKYWIQSMVQHFNRKDMVLGYGGYYKKKGLLNKLIRFDTFLVALQYFSFALRGKAYMGVGRNLAYKKSLFFDNKGFASHLHIASGDDDLFVKEVSTSSNTAISLMASAHTLSEPKTTVSSWIRQKTRHLTTGIYYSPYHQWMLGLWSSSQIGFWLLFIVLLLLSDFVIFVLILFAVRLLVQLVIARPVLKKIDEYDLIYLFPVFEFLISAFYIIFMLNRIFTRRRFW